MNHDFSVQELQAEIFTDEAWDEGMKIMCRAHVETENFDRTLPHIKSRHGDAQVADWCKVSSDTFARETYREAELELKELGMNSRDRSQLRHRVAVLGSEEQARRVGLKLLPLNETVDPYTGPWPKVEQY